MKKIFAILLSVTFLFEQTNKYKVNAEPTDLCLRLIDYLEDPNLRISMVENFSIGDLQNEIDNYNEEDFNEDERIHFSQDMDAYQKSIDFFKEASQREIPDEVDSNVLIGTDMEDLLESDPEYAREQANAIYEYLFSGMSQIVIDITTGNADFNDENIEAIMNTNEFHEENNEIFIRYLALVKEYEHANLEENISEVLIFLARVLLGGYKGVTFFYINTDRDSIVHAKSLLFYNSDEDPFRDLDEFFMGLWNALNN